MAKPVLDATVLLICLTLTPVAAYSFRQYTTITTEGKFNTLTLNDQDLLKMMPGRQLLFCDDWRKQGYLELWYFLLSSKDKPIPTDVALRWRIVDLQQAGPLSFKGTVNRVHLPQPNVWTPRETSAEGSCTVTLAADDNTVSAATCRISYTGSTGPMSLDVDFTAANNQQHLPESR